MNDTALIIGSTGAIGKRILKLVTNDFNTIIISGRDIKKLNSQKDEYKNIYPHINILILQIDISQINTSFEIENFLNTHSLRLKSIINTSYFANNGKFTRVAISEQIKIININITGYIYIVYWYIKYCEKNTIRGGILSFSSMCSLHGIPNTAIYSGSKAFLVSFFQALKQENQEMFFTVSCPGPFGEQEEAKNIMKVILNYMLPNPEGIAKKSYKAFQKGKTVVFPDILSKIYRLKLAQIIFLRILRKYYKYN